MTNRDAPRLDPKDLVFWVKVAALLCFLILPLGGADEISARVQQISQDTYGTLGAVIFCTLWALCVTAVIVTAFLPSFFARLVLAIFLVPSTLASAIYQSISNKPITYEHIRTWWAERGLAQSAIAAYPDAMQYAALLLVLGLLAVLLPAELRRGVGRFREVLPGLWVRMTSYAIAFGTLLVLCALNILQAGQGLGGLPAHYKGAVMFSVMMLNKTFGEQERAAIAVTVPLVGSHEPRPNVLFVINESVRGDYLDINHDRGVTPYLASMSHRVTNFGYAGSMANCSRHTHQALRIGLDMSHPIESQRRNPFIWQYAKDAGYKTVLIEGQVKRGKWNNNVGKIERELLDEVHYLNDPDEDDELWSRDQRLQEIIERTLSDSDPDHPVFIYVVQYGVHFPYEDKYPESATRFPVEASEDTPLTPRAQAINAYKNAVGWSVDPFFTTMLEGDRRFPDTVLIYTSDHGQDLMDTADAVLHCTVHDPSPYEGLVPLLTVTDHPEWKSRFESAARRNKDKASHFNIVPTILEIFGFEPSGIKSLHGSSLFDDIVLPRKFISRGINITVVSTGFQNKLLWNQLPEDLTSDKVHATLKPVAERSDRVEKGRTAVPGPI